MATNVSSPEREFDIMDPHCPSRTVLRHVTDRWTPLIVTSLGEGRMRFTQLRDSIGGVTPKVLTQTLRSMERDGLVTRHAAGSVPPRVDYELTELGRSLAEPIDAMRRWAESSAEAIIRSRMHHDSSKV
ncbi:MULTISPECIES: winged helix-turn-helix transcriptional regulator [Micrococcaceae]|uniref:winged helix-turn-helix transcriptional regulator n=1 Tax=unclassified Kocuria TaxID=2649579 RepID=UPI001EE0F637|nr:MULTISPECIES: helix-turn-helix domain-containing protein [unclassified Kocuria]